MMRILILTFAVLYIAANLLRKARQAWLFEAEQDFAQHFGELSHVTELKENKIHYLKCGQGPVLILLHGLGASSLIWAPLLAELSKKFTVFAPDLAGFGLSSVPSDKMLSLQVHLEILEEWLRKLGLKDVSLVGSSLGGSIALSLASEPKNSIRYVMAIAPATDEKLVPRRLLALIPAWPIWAYLLTPHSMNLILGSRGIIIDAKARARKVCLRYMLPYLRNSGLVLPFWQSAFVIVEPLLQEKIKSVKIPVTLVYGLKDRVVKKSSFEKSLLLLPHAKAVYHETSGHHLMEDAHTWLAQQIFEDHK